MRIDCLHGYFIFTESTAGEIASFMSRFGLSLAWNGKAFTFSGLLDAPSFSLPGGKFLGYTTTEAFEGEPWQIMEANGLVYDFVKGMILPLEAILKTVKVQPSLNFFDCGGIIVPGSVTDDGKRVTEYAAHYNFSTNTFRYSMVKSV